MRMMYFLVIIQFIEEKLQLAAELQLIITLDSFLKTPDSSKINEFKNNISSAIQTNDELMYYKLKICYRNLD
jgi:hypothetical protein